MQFLLYNFQIDYQYWYLELFFHISLRWRGVEFFNNKPTLVQVMIWHQEGDKPLFKLMMIQYIDLYMHHFIWFNMLRPYHHRIIVPSAAKVTLKEMVKWMVTRPPQTMTNQDKFVYFFRCTTYLFIKETLHFWENILMNLSFIWLYCTLKNYCTSDRICKWHHVPNLETVFLMCGIVQWDTNRLDNDHDPVVPRDRFGLKFVIVSGISHFRVIKIYHTEISW